MYRAQETLQRTGNQIPRRGRRGCSAATARLSHAWSRRSASSGRSSANPFGEKRRERDSRTGRADEHCPDAGMHEPPGIAVGMLPALDYMRTLDNGEPDMAHIGTRLRRRWPTTRVRRVSDPGIHMPQQPWRYRQPQARRKRLHGFADWRLTDADEIQIWTDIDGMHNNDRARARHRTRARTAFRGGRRTCLFRSQDSASFVRAAGQTHNIPVRLLNTMEPQAKGH